MIQTQTTIPQPDSLGNSRSNSEGSLIIAVDLDGTLVRADTLHERIVFVGLRRPLQLLAALFALRSSRAAFKAKLAENAPSPLPRIPWNKGVLDTLTQLRGNHIVLCTATNREYAMRILADSKLFSGVYGSDAENNLKGSTKGHFLRDKFGHRGFSYFGNEAVDLGVWKEAAEAYVVSDNKTLVKRARDVCPIVTQIAVNRPSRILSVLREMRLHQWAKNLLIFVPLLASHRFTETHLLFASAAAFGVFCLLSSGVYILNDLLDLEADRSHPSKSLRPFAAGDLGVLFGPPLFLGLTAAGVVGASFLGGPFLLSCIAYAILTILYSATIKKVAMLDVYTLAGLYTLRLIAGGSATGIVISVWLSAFSIFIFLSLALCKRYTELLDLSAPSDRVSRRGYYTSDAFFVFALGLVFMGCATLVLAVYLSSNAVTLLYKTPAALWLAVVIVSFWGSRLWLLASRRQMHDDPVFFALKDVVSWVCLALLFGVFFAAMKLG